jgi:hypothetical protein
MEWLAGSRHRNAAERAGICLLVSPGLRYLDILTLTPDPNQALICVGSTVFF